jgi:hypothetical protein
MMGESVFKSDPFATTRGLLAHSAHVKQEEEELDVRSVQMAEAYDLEDWLAWEGNHFLRAGEDDSTDAPLQYAARLFLQAAADDDSTDAPLQYAQCKNKSGKVPVKFDSLPGFDALSETHPTARYTEMNGARYAVISNRGTTLQRRRLVCLEGGGGKCDQLARDSRSKRCRKHGGGIKCASPACPHIAKWDSVSLTFSKFCAAHGGCS